MGAGLPNAYPEQKHMWVPLPTEASLQRLKLQSLEAGHGMHPVKLEKEDRAPPISKVLGEVDDQVVIAL